MGFCFSCCRRRDESPERKPLLKSKSQDHLPPLPLQFEKLGDVFAALHAGKLPSQEQINVVVQSALRSEALNSDVGLGYGILRDEGRHVVADVRRLLQAVLQVGLEKNDDDRLQRLVFETRQISPAPVHIDADVDAVAAAIPTETELKRDAAALLKSLRTLTRLLVTSSAFRVLLADVLVAARELAADAAAEVGVLAAQVEGVAAQVEGTVRPDGTVLVDEEFKGKAREDITGHAPVKEVVLDRVEDIIYRAQQNPAYHSSLVTLLYLLRKYAERASVASTAVVSPETRDGASAAALIVPDPSLVRVLADVKTLLERFAAGHSLDGVLAQLETAVRDVAADGAAQAYFADVGRWLERALAEHGWAGTRSGRRGAEGLYERGREVLGGGGAVGQDVRALIGEVEGFVEAVREDAGTRRLVEAVEALVGDTGAYVREARRGGRWREEVRRGLMGWVLARAGRVIRALPMPRVEMRDARVDWAVDGVVLAAEASFMPDHVRVGSWSEVRVDVSEDGGGAVGGFGRTRIHVEGLRFAARNIGYYGRYKGAVGYEDEGMVSVVVGESGAVGDGMRFDIELETEGGEEERLFRVTDVKVDVRGLKFAIDGSRHWILNKVVVEPLLGPVVRRVMGHVLAREVAVGLETLEGWLRAVRSAAGEGAGIEEYWSAALEGLAAGDDGDDGRVETHTHMTGKGVVRTTVTEAGSSTVAVGVGAQLLPDTTTTTTTTTTSWRSTVFDL